MATTLYKKKGGHCFFILKSDVTLEYKGYIKTKGVSNLTLPKKAKGEENEKNGINRWNELGVFT